MALTEELRLMAKIAIMYYEQDLRQVNIAHQLDLSQATVSRLLKRALQEGIVRISVSTPRGYYPELEKAVKECYGLKEVIVTDAGSNRDERLRNMGTAAAYYLETTIYDGEIIGVASWSESLLATVNAMRPLTRKVSAQVVQIQGGIGSPSAEAHAVQLAQRLAQFINGQATLLSTPGVVGSIETRDILVADPYIAEAINSFSDVTLALVGIGAIEPSRLLVSSGNVFSKDELKSLRDAGAVGDVNLRFIDEQGQPINSPLDDRVIGMSLNQFQQVKRTVGIAGGKRKFKAIRAALWGGWIHVLVTDQHTAEYLVKD